MSTAFECNSSDVQQKFYIADDGSFNIRSKADDKCLDIEAWSTSDGATIVLDIYVPPRFSVHFFPFESDIVITHRPENQQWTFDTTSQWAPILSKMDGKCVDISNWGASDGSLVWQWTYNAQDNQLWHYDATNNFFISKWSGLCLRVGMEPVPTCQDAPLNTYTYCNPYLPVGQRVDDLISRMTLEEKMGQMVNSAPPISHLGIPAYDWWTECLHGILTSCGTNCPTSFPEGPALGTRMGTTPHPHLTPLCRAAAARPDSTNTHAALAPRRRANHPAAQNINKSRQNRAASPCLAH
ncbi:hypothetical protein Pelo_503 [Pelomyxa schiedti]|nr:hypothetical protein Pelo_503 [Pelomyxa schiedti]